MVSTKLIEMRPTPQVDLAAISSRVAGIVDLLLSREDFANSVDYLKQCGFSKSFIARLLGIPRTYLYWWADGTVGQPQVTHLFHKLFIIEWANAIREAKARELQANPNIVYTKHKRQLRKAPTAHQKITPRVEISTTTEPLQGPD